MAIETHATYRAGVLHLAQPLGLPENAHVSIIVTPIEEPSSRGGAVGRPANLRPKAPRFTAEELRERIAKYGVHVGTLPADFSREDIYSDHD